LAARMELQALLDVLRGLPYFALDREAEFSHLEGGHHLGPCRLPVRFEGGVRRSARRARRRRSAVRAGHIDSRVGIGVRESAAPVQEGLPSGRVQRGHHALLYPHHRRGEPEQQLLAHRVGQAELPAPRVLGVPDAGHPAAFDQPVRLENSVRWSEPGLRLKRPSDQQLFRSAFK
jgi:hypothetical protein